MKQKILCDIVEIVLGILIILLEITLFPHTCCDVETQHITIIIATAILTFFKIWDLIIDIIRSKDETKNK